MKLFSKTELSWNEPYFFILRLRRPRAWAVRGLIALGIALLLLVAMFFARQPAMPVLPAIGISLLAGLVLMAIPDLCFFQREVTIKSDGILCYGSVGYSTTHKWFDLPKIQSVDLIRPEDWHLPHGAFLLHQMGVRMPTSGGRPYGAMLVHSSDDSYLMAVPHKVSTTTIANVLHRLGVSVRLQDWTPPEADTRVQVTDEVALAPEAARFAEPARIWPVTEQDGKLTPHAATAVALVVALGPLAIALIGAIAAAIYVIVKWKVLGALDKSLIGGGALAALVVTFLYLLFIGQFAAARYQVGVGKRRLGVRPNALFGPDEERLVPVEVFDRKAWTSMICKSIDFGFLQVDPRGRLLLFEGDKNRWRLPASSLTRCRIEEAHVGSEGNAQAEKRYYVVLSVDRDGEEWEVGLIPTRTQFGHDGKDARYARARGLFEQLEEVVAGAPAPAHVAS